MDLLDLHYLEFFLGLYSWTAILVCIGFPVITVLSTFKIPITEIKIPFLTFKTDITVSKVAGLVILGLFLPWMNFLQQTMTDEIENLRQQQFVSLPFPDTEEARRAVIREEARRAAITNQWKEFYGELTYSIKTPAFAFIRYNPERPNQLMLSAVQKWLKRIVKLVPAMFLVFQGGVIIKWAYIGGAVDWGFLSWVSSLVFILLIVVIVWRWLGAIDYGLTEIKETVLNIATLANATMRLD